MLQAHVVSLQRLIGARTRRRNRHNLTIPEGKGRPDDHGDQDFAQGLMAGVVQMPAAVADHDTTEFDIPAEMDPQGVIG